jgi:hypothetical protein
MAIQTRSPHFETLPYSGISYGILQIYIWTGDKTSVPSTAIYTLRKSADTSSGLPRVTFETAELIRDYLDITFDGDYSGQGVWVKHTLTVYNSSNSVLGTNSTTDIAFDGYEYFEESSISYPVMITNRKLFVLDDNAFRIPIYTESNPTVTFLKDNEIVATQTFTASNQSSEQIKYVSIYGNSTNWDSFKERVLESGGTSFETNKCLEACIG